jgi:deoxyuridine 5'-triphosphate nucleotidohydrolase
MQIDSYFSTVDTDAKAYLLGWLASDGEMEPDDAGVSLYVRERDSEILVKIRNAIGHDLSIHPKMSKDVLGFTLASKQVAADVKKLLDANPSGPVAFPALATDALKWAFVRGYFDGNGAINVPTHRGEGSMPHPRLDLQSPSPRLLDAIAAFCGMPSERKGEHLYLGGNNALDFLARIYEGAPIAMWRKRELFFMWSAWVPGLSGSDHHGRAALFRWAKCHEGAMAPSKAHASDSGYDLTLIDVGQKAGNVQFFRTGIKIQPSFGWYFDLVPRSSITKTGYLLANSVGIIDRAYVGEVLVPLLKIDPSAPELPLPARIVQIVPRPIIHGEFVEVPSLEQSIRGSGGFGSTGQR